MKISIIIPAFNEIFFIETLLKKVTQIELGNIIKEIIVVDDYSNDGTSEYLLNFKNSVQIGASPYEFDNKKNYHVIIHKSKQEGKGSAVKTGLASSTGDIILIQDADLEYSPEYYLALISPIIQNNANIVYGSRFLKPSSYQPIGFHYLWANKILTKFCNLLINSSLTDLMTGYKSFRKEVVKDITLKQNGFSFEAEFTIKAIKNGYCINEVPISYIGRKRAEGKKIKFKDFLLICWFIFKIAILYKPNKNIHRI